MKSEKLHIKCVISLIAAVLTAAIILCSCSLDFDFNEKGALPDGERLTVHYLDIGQGDSIFVEMPDSRTMLIDAGVSGVGEQIKKYIEDLGYSKIDYLVATHPHADHIGSMKYIVENMEIGKIYMTSATTTTKTFENLLTAISENGYKITNAQAGKSIIDEENFTVDIIGPEEFDEDNLNNSSIILKMTYKSNKFLFVGDAEEEELSSVTSDMSADVLKVGHHGSRTSTTEEFLMKVNPKYAVISCGKDNDYGHPHTSTIELLEEFNVEYYRTDEQGTITVSSDGSSINISSEK